VQRLRQRVGVLWAWQARADHQVPQLPHHARGTGCVDWQGTVAETGVDSLDGGGTMACMEDITWPFVALMAVLLAGQALVVWIASRR